MSEGGVELQTPAAAVAPTTASISYQLAHETGRHLEENGEFALASELLAVSVHIGTLIFATAYQRMCAPRHDKAVGILTAIAYIGSLSWSATLFRRRIAKRILTSLQSHARTR